MNPLHGIKVPTQLLPMAVQGLSYFLPHGPPLPISRPLHVLFPLPGLASPQNALQALPALSNSDMHTGVMYNYSIFSSSRRPSLIPFSHFFGLAYNFKDHNPIRRKNKTTNTYKINGNLRIGTSDDKL